MSKEISERTKRVLERVIQTTITMEELGELNQALGKYVRYITSDDTLRQDRCVIEAMVLEEIADVELTLYKFKKMMCIEECDLEAIKEYKVERTYKKLTQNNK